MALSRYGQNLTYTDEETIYSGDEIKLNHGVADQASGALSALAPGVRAGWLASAGSGLTVNVAAGEGIVSHSTYGAVALRSTGTIASAAIPASSVGYIHALAESDASPGGNRSVETMRPKFIYSDLNTMENATCIAYVVTGASSVTAVYDRRRIIDPEGDGFGGQFAQDDANTVGLTVAFLGGRLAQSDGTVIDVNPFTRTIASGDSYIDIDEDGAAYVRTSSTPVAGHKCLWAATANSTQIVTATKDRDRRTGFDFGAGGGGGVGEVTGTGGITVTDGDSEPVVSITDGGVTDAKIGNRTVDQTLITPGNTGALTSLLSWIVGRIKAITGETNWYDAPDITLAATKAHVDAAAPHTGHFDVDGSKALTGDMDFGGFEGTNALPGTTPYSLATVSQVDAVASGYKDLENVKVMATANVALSGLSSIDGVSLLGGDRVLLVGQTTESENGSWLASAGAWARPVDFDTGDTPDAGTRIFVVNGTAKKGTSWTLLSAGAVIDTDPLLWTQTGAAGAGEANTASNVGTGTGLIFKAKAGLDLVFKSIKTASARLSVVNNADDITLDVVEANIDINALGGALPLGVTKGGTGLSAWVKGAFPYASATNVFSGLAPNGTSTPKYLQQTNDDAPVWAPITVAGYAGTSTTPLSIGTGSKTATTQAGLGYTPGLWVKIVSPSDPAKFMKGPVTSYSGTALTIDSQQAQGSGTLSSWNINITPETISGALLAVNNLSDLANAGTARTNLGLGTAAVVADNTLVHLAGTEAITGKKTLSTELVFTEIATPSTPSATHHSIYPKSDGKLYHLNSAGTEAEIGAGGGGAVAVPPTNPEYDLEATAAPASVTYAVTVNGGTPANVAITPGDSASTVRAAFEALADIITAVVSGTTNALGAGVDQTGSGTASASTTFGGFPASDAFDNNAATSWAANGAIPQRLSYDFGSGNAKVINYHSVTPVLSGGVANPNAPKSLELYGSNVSSPSADETDWTLLDSQSWTWGASTSIGWTFTNTTPYRWMRHKYLSQNVPSNAVQVAEIVFGINATTSNGTYHVEITNPAGCDLLITTSDTGWDATSTVTGDMGTDGTVTPPDKKNLNSIEAAVSASSLGTLSKKIEVFDASGNSLGFVPVYTSIT